MCIHAHVPHRTIARARDRGRPVPGSGSMIFAFRVTARGAEIDLYAARPAGHHIYHKYYKFARAFGRESRSSESTLLAAPIMHPSPRLSRCADPDWLTLDITTVRQVASIPVHELLRAGSSIFM